MAEMDAILRDLQNSSDPWKHIFHPLGVLVNNSNPPPVSAAANPPSPYEVVELAPITAATTRTSQRIASKRNSDSPRAEAVVSPAVHSQTRSSLSKPPARKPTFDELSPEHQAIDTSLRQDYGYKSSDLPKRQSSPLPGLGHSRRTPNDAVAILSGNSAGGSQRDQRAAKRSAVAAAVEEDLQSLADSAADTPSKRKKRDYKRLTAEQIKNMTPEERKIYDAKRAKNRAAVDKTREKKEKEEAERIKKEKDEKMKIERENQLLSSTMAKLIENAIKLEIQHGCVIYNHEAMMNKEEKTLYRAIRAQVEKNMH